MKKRMLAWIMTMCMVLSLLPVSALAVGEEEQTGGEGCLSVPGKTGTVTRPNYVKAIAFNENMEAYEIEATELLARAICHETDHLDGELYVSKVEGQLMDTEEYYEKMDGTEVLDEE